MDWLIFKFFEKKRGARRHRPWIVTASLWSLVSFIHGFYYVIIILFFFTTSENERFLLFTFQKIVFLRFPSNLETPPHLWRIGNSVPRGRIIPDRGEHPPCSRIVAKPWIHPTCPGWGILFLLLLLLVGKSGDPTIVLWTRGKQWQYNFLLTFVEITCFIFWVILPLYWNNFYL